jgi:glycogen debranching enzyme
VQSYVYAAKRGAATLAKALGVEDRSRALLLEADILKKRFEETFWCDDLSTYAIALDGNNQLCRVRSSNAAHCLFTGIASQDAAEKIAAGLMEPDFFSGWGVRTIATSEARYNPMSYHNGSVWPHDNALIAYGLAGYGFKEHVLKVLTGVFESSLLMERHRLPELICGFERRPGEGPTLYPVACSPQSWSAGAVFLLLQASLGLSVNANEKRVYLMHPRLPNFLEQVQITNLRVGDGSVDLLLERTEQHIGFSILRKEEDIQILMID